ncbi:PA2169 family four-helix-bundle protein [Euzebya tangerina]|uniref:PA2169 family four-helix-bundle protein n=1 Tax=Euzebya tangerina TaxID=591198 RepID=UPI000E31E888|nr:PA2169 family four-helix-bundle protein [Euzebya tangerina]
MSTTRVYKDLVETLEDGRKGFADGADKLRDSGEMQLADLFAEMSQQRQTFSSEIRDLAMSVGETIDEDGSLGGSLHRGWMTLKDALTGSDATGILNAAETGEQHALSEFEDALGNEDLPAQARPVIQRQLDAIRQSQTRLQGMANAR